MNQSCILLGALRLLSRQSLERLTSGRTMEGLKGGTGGKKIAREIVVMVRGEVEDGIGEVNVGEDSFLVKLSCKIIEKMSLVARSTNSEAMRSKEAVRRKSIGNETKGIID